MKRFGPILIGWWGFLLAFVAVAAFLPEPANCQTAGVVLLLQQTPEQGGIVSPQLGIHHFEPDSAVTLTAVPSLGYQFVYWLGDVVDPTSTKTIAILDKPKIIIAVFQQIEFDHMLVGQNAPGGGGTPTPILTSRSLVSAAAPRGGGRPPDNPPLPPTEGDDPIPPDDPPPIPEPATGILLALGALALVKRRRA